MMVTSLLAPTLAVRQQNVMEEIRMCLHATLKGGHLGLQYPALCLLWVRLPFGVHHLPTGGSSALQYSVHPIAEHPTKLNRIISSFRGHACWTLTHRSRWWRASWGWTCCRARTWAYTFRWHPSRLPPCALPVSG